MIDRKEELMQYLTLLIQLSNSDFNCFEEMQDVVKELHNLMGFKKDKKIKITIGKPADPAEVINEFSQRIMGVHGNSKGSGRTHTLINLAKKYNIPIIVRDFQIKDSIQRTSPDVTIYVAGETNLRGLQFPNGVLIDNSVLPEQYHYLLRQNLENRIAYFV